MVARPLGRTGLRITPIGFGAFKIGRNEKVKYPQEYELPKEHVVRGILASVLDLGINYIDTAPAYGLSEQRIGQFLPPRDNLVISTKVGEVFADGESRYEFTADAIRASLTSSLRLLRRDALDIVFLHVPAADLEVLHNTEAVAALRRAKESGVARAIGFSAKTVAAAMESLAWADVLMLEYHLEDRSFESVIRAAGEQNIGVVVKKGLASGRLDANQAIPFVLREPAVASMVIGSLSVAHLRQAVEIADRVLTPSATDQK